jgi:hypothetical protein
VQAINILGRTGEISLTSAAEHDAAEEKAEMFHKAPFY